MIIIISSIISSSSCSDIFIISSSSCSSIIVFRFFAGEMTSKPLFKPWLVCTALK